MPIKNPATAEPPNGIEMDSFGTETKFRLATCWSWVLRHSDGIPTYKFRISITENTTFTKRVVSYGDRTEYTLTNDNYGYRETWIDTSPKTQQFTKSSKVYTKGVEYHIDVDCKDKDMPGKFPPFPIHIINYLPG